METIVVNVKLTISVFRDETRDPVAIGYKEVTLDRVPVAGDFISLKELDAELSVAMVVLQTWNAPPEANIVEVIGNAELGEIFQKWKTAGFTLFQCPPDDQPSLEPTKG